MLEHDRVGAGPRQPRGPRDRRRRRAAHPGGAAAVTQGRADTICLPAMAEHILATCPTAEASWYDGVGHTAHLEQPERFNRELAALTRRVRA